MQSASKRSVGDNSKVSEQKLDVIVTGAGLSAPHISCPELKCVVKEVFEFCVDASEAGEGQLEIAVNEGEIPNQVQVLDNGKCIVTFLPEEIIPHIVDVKFNGSNVDGCPFVVQVAEPINSTQSNNQVSSKLNGTPSLIIQDRILVNHSAAFHLDNVDPQLISDDDLQITDPENQPVRCELIRNPDLFRATFDFKPSAVGDYTVELKSDSRITEDPLARLLEQFPFSLKVFDHNKVTVSDVTDGVIGHPVYFFIDATQAGSGNLEIKVSSKTRTVPNRPQSESNARIRVNFTPTEAIDHYIDVRFNGLPVAGNPFLVKVAQFPQARLPVSSLDVLKYVAINEVTTFCIDYLGDRVARNNTQDITVEDCQVHILTPDLKYERLDSVKLLHGKQGNESKARLSVDFKPNRIGPYKIFITMNNELVPCSPVMSNAYNIDEVKVTFEASTEASENLTPVGEINRPIKFTVDASKAGEGTLALAVTSGMSQNHVQTDVEVSEKGHGLYDLTFVPSEFAPHLIEMSFNEKKVPKSPFIVDLVDASGDLASAKYSHRPPALIGDSTVVDNSDVRPNIQNFGSQNIQSYSPMNKLKNSEKAQTGDEELLNNIVVHGISLKCTPVNSTGAFIIETNRTAHAQDFDVLITDPRNDLVDVQCYLQQDGNLLAEWTPKRIGSHKIEVLFKELQVPGSPFMTEAFDPSGVLIKDINKTVCSVNDIIKFKLDRRDAGFGELDVAITSPVGQDLPINVLPIEDENELGELISFTPSIAGIYKLSVTFGGYEVPKSPITFTAVSCREPVKASGPGLKSALVNKSTQFSIQNAIDGELKLRIELGDREIVPKIEKRPDSHVIKYRPTEIGIASVSLYWNGSPITGSPFLVPVNDLSRILFLNGTSKQSVNNNQRCTNYAPGQTREVTVDTSMCGPGRLRAEAQCQANPSVKFSVPIEMYSANKYKVSFKWPPGEEQLAKGVSFRDTSPEATYLIRFYYNNLLVPEHEASVILSPCQSSKQPSQGHEFLEKLNHPKSKDREFNHSMDMKAEEAVECPVVALRGLGLVEAKCGVPAEFTIDGTEAGLGQPDIRLGNESETIKISLEQMRANVFKATYSAHTPGRYALNVLWGGKQVAGCPIEINVIGGCDPSKVLCTGDGLKGGTLGEEIQIFIDTRRAGAGELTAVCTGAHKAASCELLDRGDGTFVLYVKPQEPGRQFLSIQYGGHHVPKSPFLIKISGKPDPTRVRVYGPGVEHGVLSLYQSRFVCDTRGAGAGQLTVRIRGPRGAFRMETQRESQRDRTILCKYDPTEPGDYRIEIKWSGHHVPGSPFAVMIFDTQEELNRFLVGWPVGPRKEKLASTVNHLQNTHQSTFADYSHNSKAAASSQPHPHYRL